MPTIHTIVDENGNVVQRVFVRDDTDTPFASGTSLRLGEEVCIAGYGDLVATIIGVDMESAGGSGVCYITAMFHKGIGLGSQTVRVPAALATRAYSTTTANTDDGALDSMTTTTSLQADNWIDEDREIHWKKGDRVLFDNSILGLRGVKQTGVVIGFKFAGSHGLMTVLMDGGMVVDLHPVNDNVEKYDAAKKVPMRNPADDRHRKRRLHFD